MNIIDTAREYAIRCHSETNHLYDGKPYAVHLNYVYSEAKKFCHLIPTEHRDNFLAAAWVHDVIEDCRQTYNDVKNATNKEVAELAYALTNEKGKNRKERASVKYYNEIKKVPYAVLLKVCDRLANFKYSIESGSRMAAMYAKENHDFDFYLNDGSCDVAFAELTILSDNVSHQTK